MVGADVIVKWLGLKQDIVDNIKPMTFKMKNPKETLERKV
jgi:hypothetical protein